MGLFKKVKSFNKKVFVIGLGKTGTTSTETALRELGYTLGYQRQGELLMEKWAKREFKSILDFCDTAEAFQDVPFCLPYTFIHLHAKYPDAKFILTLRDNAETWADSLIRFHSKLYASGERVPTIQDLKDSTYIFKGQPYLANRFFYDTPEDDPYNKSYLMKYYDHHVQSVRDYFRHIPGHLLEVNVKHKDDYLKFCHFLGKNPLRDSFPWENKTESNL